MGEQNFIVKRGDSATKTITWNNSQGQPYDLTTGYKVFFTIKAKLTDSDEDATYKQDQDTFPDGALGKFNISFPIAIDAGSYFYDVQTVSPDSVVKTILYGKIQFIDDVTKRTE